MSDERTFIAIKPDGVQRGLISSILGRFEQRGFKLVGIKLVQPTESLLRNHYEDLQENRLNSEVQTLNQTNPENCHPSTRCSLLIEKCNKLVFVKVLYIFFTFYYYFLSNSYLGGDC